MPFVEREIMAGEPVPELSIAPRFERERPCGGVAWKSPPLFNLQLSRAAIVAVLGELHATNLDSNGVGLFDAWALRISCGLEVTIMIFHTRPDGRWEDITDPQELAAVEVNMPELALPLIVSLPNSNTKLLACRSDCFVSATCSPPPVGAASGDAAQPTIRRLEPNAVQPR